MCRFQYLGLALGMSDGDEPVHYLVEDSCAGPGELSDQFLYGVEQATSLTTNPLFALLNDACCARRNPGREPRPGRPRRGSERTPAINDQRSALTDHRGT